MRADDPKSPIPASSGSESQDAHPMDAVISAVKNRDSAQSSPAVIDITSPDVHINTKRKRRSQTTSPAEINSDDLTQQQHSTKRAKRTKSPTAALPASNPPVGVTVVDEGEHVRNPEMQRLLRGARQVFSPRYLHICA